MLRGLRTRRISSLDGATGRREDLSRARCRASRLRGSVRLSPTTGSGDLPSRPSWPHASGGREHNDRWRDWSKAARARARAAREEFLQQVLYVGAPATSRASEHLSADLLEYELRTALEVEPYVDLVGRVSQSDGLHNEVFVVVDQMPARTVRDYENIIARLRALPAYIDQSIELMREQLASGFAQPAVVVEPDARPGERRRPAPRRTSHRCWRRFRSFPSDIGTTRAESAAR